MPDFTNYTPPGVYVEDVSRQVADAINPLLNDELLAIVAPAQGYVTASETVTLSSTTPTVLVNTGVVQDSSLVVATAGGTVLVKDTDYSVAVDSTNPDAPTTSLLRLPSDPATASPGGLIEGGTVVVSYHYADATYFQPQVFSDFSTLAKVYGPGLSSDAGGDPVVSPLSLAAQIAFENGASRVMAVAVDHKTASWKDDFKTTYDLLATDHRVSVLVPVFPENEADTAAEMTGLLTDLRLHVDAAAANGYGRLVIAGAAGSYDDTVDPFGTVSSGVANKRIVTVFPNRYTMFNPALAKTVEVGGGYAAAALGGILMYNDVQRGLTRKVVNSLTGIPALISRRMTKAFKDGLAADGTLVIEINRLNRLVVRHGITTDVSSIFNREISLVRIGDVLLQDIQVGMENAGLIGEPIDAEMSTRVKSTIIGILETEVAENVIVTYDQVAVRQQALPNGDPSVIEVQFSYKPAVPLNYITVSFALNLDTGVVSTSTDDLATTA